jgi:pimeloyl-ACP methyl ester carboxylesterase
VTLRCLLFAVLTLPAAAQPLELAFSQLSFSMYEVDHQLSPDGNFLVCGLRQVPGGGKPVNKRDTHGYDASGVPQEMRNVRLFLWDLRSGTSRALTPPGSTSIRPSWSPDGRTLCFYSNHQGSLSPWIRTPDGKLRRLSEKRVAPARWSGDRPLWAPDGKAVIVPLATEPVPAARNKPAPRVLSTTTSEPTNLRSEDSFYKLQTANLVEFDLQGRSKTLASRLSGRGAALSPSGRYLLAFSSGTPSATQTNAGVVQLHVVSRDGRPVTTVRDLAIPDPQETVAGWDQKEDKLLFLRDSHLYQKNLTGGSEKPVTPEPVKEWAGLTRISADRTRAWVGGQPLSLPAGVRSLKLLHPDGPLLRGLDAEGNTLLLRGSRVLLRRKCSLELLGTHGGRLVTQYEDFQTSPAIRVFSPEGTPLSTHLLNPTLRMNLAEPRQAPVDTIDPQGKPVTLRPSVIERTGTPADAPAICILYPNAVKSSSLGEFAGGGHLSFPNWVWLTRGFKVVLLDSRLGAEDQPAEPARVLADQTLAQVDRLAQLGWVAPDRLVLAGQSAGGYATLAVLTQTNRFRCGIGVSGFYDPISHYGLLDSGGGNWGGLHNERFLRLQTNPWDARQRYAAASPYLQARSVQNPVLLIHGQEDSGCPEHEAGMMFSALRKLGKRAEFVSYPGEGHVLYDWSWAHGVDAVKRMLDFADSQR